MAGTKVSNLNAATSLGNNDLLYVVNNGNPTKSTLSVLGEYLSNTYGFIKTVNEIPSSNGTLLLTKSHLGLANVPDTSPVTSMNSLTGDITLLSGNGVNITNDGNEISFNLTSNFSLDFSQISGPVANNITLSTILSNIGAQNPPRQLTESNSSMELLSTDSQVNWVNADFAADTTLTVDEINVPIGGIIEIRQGGMGKVSVVANSGAVIISTPVGTWNQTQGFGSRIQLISLGENSWEFR